MKTLVLLVIVLLFFVGCGNSADSNDASGANSNQVSTQSDSSGPSSGNQPSGAQANSNANNPDLNQELVNFKCTMGDAQKYYFYKNKIKLESPASEAWMIDDVYYAKMNVNGKDYLVTGIADGTQITTEQMINMYKNSKMTPNLDCTLGGVTEDIVTLPDLEVITNDELATKMMEGMTQGTG